MDGGGIHGVYCLSRDISLFRGDQERKGVILVETLDPVVELLVELIRTQGGDGVPSSLPLMVSKSGSEGRIWTRRQATQCLRSGIEKVAER